jgi:hypothetical protein
LSKIQKLLLLLLFLGLAGNIGGSGTLASFNASTTNGSSTFATGSIVLSNLNKTTSKTCFSNGTTDVNGGTGTSTNSNANTACEALFNLSARTPGQTATVNLNLKNEGSLPGTLTVKAVPHIRVTGAASVSQACTSEDTLAIQTAYHGTGDICDKLRFTIQRYTTDGRTIAYTTAPGGCVYGTDANVDNLCDANDDTRDLKHFTETSLAASTGISLGTLAAADTAYLTLKVEFADGGVGADNAFQGRAATFAVQWGLG